MDEAILRKALSQWPSREDAERHALLAHERLATLTNASQIVTCPLTDEADNTWGAIVLVARKGTPIDGDFLQAWATSIAGCIRINLLLLHRRRRERGFGRQKLRLYNRIGLFVNNSRHGHFD